MKKYAITVLVLVASLAIGAYWWLNREVTLVDLQKELLFAKTAADTAKVIDRLEQYYLELEVPNSIIQKVDSAVAVMLADTTKLKPEGYSESVGNDSNVYKLESRLQDLFERAMIACVRGDEQIFQTILAQIKRLAQIVDIGKGVKYWEAFVEKARRFTQHEANSWLKAKRAESLCRSYQDNLSEFGEAERYAAIGLRSLQYAYDERTRLDIMQRLQYIIYFHRSMYDISQTLGKKLLVDAENIGYLLRACGIRYHQAEALFRDGKNHSAMLLYKKIIHDTYVFRDKLDLSFFNGHSLMGLGRIYLEQGEFDDAMMVCDEVEKKNPDPKARIRLKLLRGDIYRNTAHYQLAENVLNEGLVLAKVTRDTFNLIMCLNNLGVLFERLQEYDLALDYYGQAQSFFGISDRDVSTRFLILNNIADIAAARSNASQFETISREAQALSKLIDIPWRKAEMLHHIGNMYKKNQQHDRAISYFKLADSFYVANGFLSFALGTKLDLSDCLIALSKFDEAKTILTKIETFAGEIAYQERVIDAIGRRARIEYLEGNIAQAKEAIKQLLADTEEVSKRIKDSPDLLMSYRQKRHDILKDAVFYELLFFGKDSAFTRLSSIKAYALQDQLMDHSGNDHQAKRRWGRNLKSIQSCLDEKSLLIDYMVTNDTLYAFVLRTEGLRLFRKKIELANLRKNVSAYKDSISRTIQVFQYYKTSQVEEHYAGTVALAEKLYDDLLGWPELDFFLMQSTRLIIIPDEFLYELPFSTLVTKNIGNKSFVADRQAVLTLPSSNFLQRGSFNLKQANVERILVSIDRQFSGTEPFAAKIKTLFPKSEELQVNNDNFTKDDVLVQLQKDFQFYIFVGHGASNSKHPDSGYIELSIKTPKGRMPKPVRLTVADLKVLDWSNAKMVMLVGCETARGKLYRGTGISGLQQELSLLGAQSVLGNLWEVEANHAIAQAEDFLISWITTRNAEQALQASQRKAIQELRQSDYFKQPHPYFWGSYVISTVGSQSFLSSSGGSL